LSYNGVDISRDIAPFLLSFSYTDHAGASLDEIGIELQAIDELWGGKWFPQEGDSVSAEIVAEGWDGGGSQTRAPMQCGTFELCDIDVDGPPERVSLKCVSAPLGSGLRRQRKHKSWENTRLRAICADIAAGAGLSLLYDTTVDPLYSRKDQQYQSDLAFLEDFCARNGLRLKISTDRLIVFSEAEYEQRAPVFSIDKADGLFTGYGFQSSLAESYRACELTYSDAEGKGGYSATFTPPDAQATGEVLRINERVESQAEADRRARTALREKNRAANRASFTLPFNPRIVGAATGTLLNWRPRYNGEYMVDSVTHTVGAGATSSVELHKALVGY